MKKKGVNKKLVIGLSAIIFIIAIAIIFYSYMFFQFKIDDIVYSYSKGLGKVKGMSLTGQYLVQWQDGSFSKESLFTLKEGSKVGTDEIKKVVKNKDVPNYFFYPFDSGKKAIILSNYSGGGVIEPELIPSYEEKGLFVWKIGKGDCKSSFICETWSKCRFFYNLESLLTEELTTGTKSRTCRDYAGCFSDFVEFQDCKIEESISTKKININGRDYLEVYDSKNNSVAKLELVNATTKKLNVYLEF